MGAGKLLPLPGSGVGAALTVNDRITCGAAKKLALPVWSALMMHAPAVTNVIAPPPVIVQTPVVAEAKATLSPDDAIADRVGVVPKFWAPGLVKVIV
jgi:hypothetical protein